MSSLLERDAKRLLQSVQPPDLLRVVLDNQNGWYFPGQNVNGEVIIRTKEQIKSRGVYASCQGKAKTSWMGQPNVEGRSVQHSAEVVYADIEQKLWSPATGEKYLPLGETRFRFTFQIPANAAPTFEGTYGNIRYVIKATIDRPWFLDCKQEVGFTVLPFLDLNLIPSAAEPVIFESYKEFSSLFSRNGRVTVRACLPKSGFVAGEGLPITVQIQNSTDKRVKQLFFEILQQSHYTATFLPSYRNAASQQTEASGASQAKLMRLAVGHREKTFDSPAKGNFDHAELVKLPAVVPTFNVCKIIQVDYVLKTTVILKSNESIECELPFLIGTVPLRPTSATPSMTPSAMPSMTPAATGPPAGLYPALPSLPSAPPPDYDASQVQVADAHIHHGKVFPAGPSNQPDSGEAPPEYTPKAVYYPNL